MSCQVLQHFGVREYWPPLGQLTAGASARAFGSGWGPRVVADADAGSFMTSEFWNEVRLQVIAWTMKRSH